MMISKDNPHHVKFSLFMSALMVIGYSIVMSLRDSGPN